jgi:hypothetical protein
MSILYVGIESAKNVFSDNVVSEGQVRLAAAQGHSCQGARANCVNPPSLVGVEGCLGAQH